MPLINLEYDDSSVSEDEVQKLSNAVKDIVSEVTGIADVFVYANTAKIKVQIAPVEIFVRMSAKIKQEKESLMEEVKVKLKEWKKEVEFTHPINPYKKSAAEALSFSQIPVMQGNFASEDERQTYVKQMQEKVENNEEWEQQWAYFVFQKVT